MRIPLAGTLYVRLFCLLVTATSQGCTTGLLYTDVTRPKCKDMRSTPLGNAVGKSGTFKIEIPTSRLDFTAEWNSKAFGDISKKSGLDTFYFCDQRTLSVLLGLFRKEEMILYGRKSIDASPPMANPKENYQ